MTEERGTGDGLGDTVGVFLAVGVIVLGGEVDRFVEMGMVAEGSSLGNGDSETAASFSFVTLGGGYGV